MELTKYTDYSLRILIYLAITTDHLVTVDEIAEVYGISRHHVAKAVFHLSRMGVVLTTRGRTGGMRLACNPQEINLGKIVHHTEPHMNLLECFDVEINTCPLVEACRLKSVLRQAKKAFLGVLEQYTLADMVHGKNKNISGLLE